MYFSREFLETLKLTVNILDIVSSYTQLKKVDKNTYQGRCPHSDHNDSVASFTVFLDTNSWCCLGCHAGKKSSKINTKNYGSDVIAFIQWIENKSWTQAIIYLSKKYNISLPKQEHEDYYNHKKRLAKAYNKTLLKTPSVREYLYSRGIEDVDIEKHLIGFDGYRITVPIKDIGKNIVGFTSRKYYNFIERKYKNTATNDCFQKRNTLFGIDNYDSSYDYIFITEGCFDVLLSVKYNLKNVFAPLGTAFTEEQALLISKLNKKVVFVFDGDEAGDKAIHKSIELAIEHKITHSIVRLPDGKDLADMANIHKDNLEAYLLMNKKPYNLYLIESVSTRHMVEMYEVNERYIKEYISIIESIPDVTEKLLITHHLKQYLNVSI